MEVFTIYNTYDFSIKDIRIIEKDHIKKLKPFKHKKKRKKNKKQ